MREAPLGHDRTAARDEARNAIGGQRDIAQQHTRMHGEVIHPLLALLDEGVAIDFPGQFLGFAIHLFKSLVDRHRADGHRRVADDPFARFMDVLAGGEVHHRVRAPLGGPAHLLDLFLNAGGYGAVADVGVDLHQEVAPDNHRLALGVVDVGRDDGTATSDFGADELGGDGGGGGGAGGFGGHGGGFL